MCLSLLADVCACSASPITSLRGNKVICCSVWLDEFVGLVTRQKKFLLTPQSNTQFCLPSVCVQNFKSGAPKSAASGRLPERGKNCCMQVSHNRTKRPFVCSLSEHLHATSECSGDGRVFARVLSSARVLLPRRFATSHWFHTSRCLSNILYNRLYIFHYPTLPAKVEISPKEQ